jgi:hypothetical protein
MKYESSRYGGLNYFNKILLITLKKPDFLLILVKVFI